LMAGTRTKRKYTHYPDEFKAGVILQLEAAGYTGDTETSRKGALSLVANTNHVSPSLISYWFKKSRGTIPTKILNKKRKDLIEGITSELDAILIQMEYARETASYQQLGTVFGILTDKKQLLKGEATQRTETEYTHKVTNDVDRSEYDEVIKQAENIISEAASGASNP
jgi:hypothetical protein